MGSFADNLRFEQGFTDRLYALTKPLIAAEGLFLGRMQRNGEGAKQALDLGLQKECGDFILYRVADGKYAFTIDLKVEKQTRRNMFFETFSNYSMDPGRCKLGWGFQIRADRIWYAFDDTGIVAIIDLGKLRIWLTEMDGRNPRSARFRETHQKKHSQANMTRGLLIPFEEIPGAVWSRCFIIEGDAIRMAGRDEFMARLPPPQDCRGH
jgi:hypothetical protein